MTTLREFEDALKSEGNEAALALLQTLKDRDKARRKAAPARRVTGRKMTPDLAHRILDLHGTTNMTQQEIAFKLGVNQGRVNEVIKRGKWLTEDPAAPEAVSRDRALERMAKAARAPKPARAPATAVPPAPPEPSATQRPEAPARAEAAATARDAEPASPPAKPSSRRAAPRPAPPSGAPMQLSLGDF